VDGNCERLLNQPPEAHVPDRWGAIVREHAPIVLGTACRILGNSADAEDVAQEVFLEAFRKWQHRPDDQWTPLLRRLATCRALDRRRRRKLSMEVAEVTEIPSSDVGPTEVAVAREMTSVLLRALEQLPHREAEVFCLRYFEDLNNSEIAAVLRIKPGAVATAICKARTKLDDRLARVLKGDLK
jgi:RNA polymerase sigma-70 factor, ECF subfamily